MRLLLDTHVLLWTLANPELLKSKIQSVIEDKNNEVFVSVVSIWELVLKTRKGKLETPDDILLMLEAREFKQLFINSNHVLAIKEIPYHHRDPFDHMLIVQAQCEQLTLVTSDKEILKYNVTTLPA